jgi:hypothetical protein
MKIGDIVTVNDFGHSYPNHSLCFEEFNFKDKVNNSLAKYNIPSYRGSSFNLLPFCIFNISKAHFSDMGNPLIGIKYNDIEMVIDSYAITVIKKSFNINPLIKVL